MKIWRTWNRTGSAPCALTIGNFDGVHRGHQAMLALLANEAKHRGLPTVVMTFEPNPRDYFAEVAGKAELAVPRIATLRDKLSELARCGVDEAVVLTFNAKLAACSAQDFIAKGIVAGLKARYVLVGDDFRFGAKRQGDYAMLDGVGDAQGFDVARMQSYEVHGLRVSSSAVRAALGEGRMSDAARLLGRPYAVSGHIVHGAKLGRTLGFRTLNLRFEHARPAVSGIFVARVLGLGAPLPAVASFGRRPTVEHAGRVLLETHVLEWPSELGEVYGSCVSVELLHKLHDERHYEGLQDLARGIQKDADDARAWWAKQP